MHDHMNINFATKAFLCNTLIIDILLTVTCISTIHTEHIVALPLQQGLRENATVLTL